MFLRRSSCERARPILSRAASKRAVKEAECALALAVACVLLSGCEEREFPPASTSGRVEEPSSPRRSELGVCIEAVESGGHAGLAITRVARRSSADAAGLKTGDLIMSAIRGRGASRVNWNLTQEYHLVQVLARYQPGGTMRLEVLRGTRLLVVKVPLRQIPDAARRFGGVALGNACSSWPSSWSCCWCSARRRASMS